MFATDMPVRLQFLPQLGASIDSVTSCMDASNLLGQLSILPGLTTQGTALASIVSTG